MANRNWRSGGYQTFNQILTPMSYYPQPVTYPAERKNYGGRGGYREDASNYKRDRKDFQSNRRERFSPNKRRSPYQRSHEAHGNFRKDSKKSHGHYEVKVPRLTFDIKELSTSSLKFRYPKMYTPSDFFHTRLNVQEAFPLYRPMKLGNHCEFQVLSKEVQVEELQSEFQEPEDANYKYSAKVMLMTTPVLSDLYKLTCHLPGDLYSTTQTKFGLYKNIQFLVGSKGKNEPMAIGGPWSPSLDGEDPEKDAQVLVRTAIRTCKALTGIDLSHCKKWFKFMDIHYYRPSERKTQTEEEPDKKEENKTEKAIDEPTVEVVTLFIPDIWSCVPSDEEWLETRAKYEKKLQSLLHPIVAEAMEVQESGVENMVESTLEETAEHKVDELNESVEDTKEETKEKVEDPTETQSTTDLNQMKVTELRAELCARGLETKGLKSQLVTRLQEAIDNEKKTVEETVSISDGVKDTVTDIVILDEVKVEVPKVELTSQLPDKEQKWLEKLYRLSEKPSILVHPSKTAKAGRFECAMISLESLLEYRIDDQKEHTFEVSLFAEQFSEMIQRDAAFVIYKALTDMPELVKDNSEPEAKKARIEVVDVSVRKSRMLTDVHLLFAFCVFDSENGGYIRDHDFENILHCIGLNLSRSQVKKLLAKLPFKKGGVVLRDVVERDVIEDSEDDIATLRTSEPNMSRLIELSYGNKAFFDEVDKDSLVTREGALQLLDKLSAVDNKMSNMKVQMTLLHDELNKLKTCQNGAADVETHLRENIKKIQDKLTIEKETHNKLSTVAKVYSDLLKSARDHMEESAKDINDQFDHERQEAEKIKEEAERVKAALAEAERAKQEAIDLASKEQAESEEKTVIVVDEVKETSDDDVMVTEEKDV